jgi:hypothetical protein
LEIGVYFSVSLEQFDQLIFFTCAGSNWFSKSFYRTSAPEYFSAGISTVAEIEAAIRALPPAERERVAEDLPSILSELHGDLVWRRIIDDPRPLLRSLRWAIK